VGAGAGEGRHMAGKRWDCEVEQTSWIPAVCHACYVLDTAGPLLGHVLLPHPPKPLCTLYLPQPSHPWPPSCPLYPPPPTLVGLPRPRRATLFSSRSSLISCWQPTT
jgi:hypothetical protein